MTKDEALDLALEALEHIDYEDNDRDFLFPYQCTMLDNAITAIKQARSAPVHKPYRPLQDNGSQYFGDSWDTPPAQPAPVQGSVAHCGAGPEYCPQCHKESRPTYGSEEVRKLREVIESQAKIIESNKPPPWFNAVENILKEYGLQAIDFVADFKAAIVDAERHPAQPAPVQEPDWSHPKIQALIGADARNRITIDLIWRILKNPNGEYTASDMEYWDAIHDAVQAAIQPAPTVQEPVAWMEMVVANLVREGVNKHKASELAERFYSLAQKAVPLTDDQIRGLTPKPDGVAEGNVRRVEVLPGVMGTEFDEVDAWSMPLVLQIARAIEAAHGITPPGGLPS